MHVTPEMAIHYGTAWSLHIFILARYRSSRPEVFCKKGALWNFAKFSGKHLGQGLLNKVAGQRQPYLKRDFGKSVFLWIFQNFQERLLLQNTSGGASEGKGKAIKIIQKGKEVALQTVLTVLLFSLLIFSCKLEWVKI